MAMRPYEVGSMTGGMGRQFPSTLNCYRRAGGVARSSLRK